MQRKISDIYFKIRKLDNYRIIIGRIKKKKNCTIFENLKRLFNWNSIFSKFFSYSKISQALKLEFFHFPEFIRKTFRIWKIPLPSGSRRSENLYTIFRLPERTSNLNPCDAFLDERSQSWGKRDSRARND